MKRAILSSAILSSAILSCAILLAGASRGAQAQGVTAGQTVTRLVTVAGKSAPLPPGEWVIAGIGAGALKDGAAPGAYGLIWNVVLIRPTQDGRAVDGIVELNVNDLAVSDGWGAPANCARTDLLLAVTRYSAGWDVSCFFVTHSLWEWRKGATPAWVDAIRHVAGRGWTIPYTTVTSGFRVANRRDVIDARFHFPTAFHGVMEPRTIDWSQSAWRPGLVDGDPRRLAFVRALSDWTALTSGYLEAGLKRRLPETPLPNPGLDAETLARESIARQRLAKLESLLKAGLISQANFNEQARIIAEKGTESAGAAADAKNEAYAKALTYAPSTAAANILIDYLWIGQPVATGALALLQATTEGFKFYFHERAWDRLVGGDHGRNKARTLDFVHEAIDE